MMDNPAHTERQEPEPATETRAGADIIYLPDDRQRAKKATSGSENRQRQHVERFRTNDAEHEALHEQLRVSGLSLGEYVMQLGKIAGGKISRPRRRREIKLAVYTEALTQAVIAINRVGNNQNQEVRALNVLALSAHEQGNAHFESQVSGRIEELRRLPDFLARPLAALMAVLSNVNDDSEG
jgi:hypothetical protein